MNISDPNSKRWEGLPSLPTQSSNRNVSVAVNTKISDVIREFFSGKNSYSLTNLASGIVKVYASALLSNVSLIFLQQNASPAANLQKNPLHLLDSSERINNLMHLIFNASAKAALGSPTSDAKALPSKSQVSLESRSTNDRDGSSDTISARPVAKQTLEGVLQESHTLRSYIESNDLQDLTKPNVPHYLNEELLTFMAEQDPGIFDYLPTLFYDSKPAAFALIPRELRSLSDFNPNFASDSEFLKDLESETKGLKEQDTLAQTIKPKITAAPTLEETIKKESTTLQSYIESNDLQDLTSPNVPHNQNERLLSSIADNDPGIFDFLPTLFKDSKPAALVLISRDLRSLSDFNETVAKDSQLLDQLALMKKG